MVSPDRVGHPIVYIRGYAGSQAEVEDTVADPYMGFNWGATKVRQEWTGKVERHIFESPLIRLMKDEGYADGFRAGTEVGAADTPPRRTVFIYRYYEPVSKQLGSGVRPEIEDYARGLDDLVESLRDMYCGPAQGADDARKAARRDFRVYLVAHSMGGLVARCYLQNIRAKRHAKRVADGTAAASDPPPVDKVFTYATPHGGIDLRAVGNIPGFLTANNIDNFNESRMRDYLALDSGTNKKQPVSSLGGAFDPERVFCLVGTNHRDYEVAMGLASFAVGSSSDGLVQIKNACVQGAPRAFVHRSHSGHYGIVNSEEGYQNLRRFLFGDVRVDAFLEIDAITLPPKVRQAKEQGRQIRASYHVEVVARVRQARWDLHRRTVGEESACFVDWDRVQAKEPVQLASTFLLGSAAKSGQRLGFSLDLRVLVPEYQVEREGLLRFLPDDHFDGGHLYREKLNLEVVRSADQPPEVRYGFDSRTPNRAGTTRADCQPLAGVPDGFEFRIPVSQKTDPGLTGTVVLRSRPWNK
ncbi:MAG: hypothetical protein H6825_07385 [Planctomycetes bacterium]|nr:hypothetical protein [Planctomycetota bacterium]